MSNPEVEFELSDRGREFATRLANNPLDLFQGKTLGWLEDFIRITVGNIEVGAGSGGAIGTHTVGHLAWVCKDLTAFTGEYVYEDDSGQYLYLNGAAVDQIIYADLYEFYGPNAYGTDASGLFLLPDARGRAPFLCGTSVNADLGDNDGISVTLRQALHQHSVTGTVASHGHTVSITSGTVSHNHTHDYSGSTGNMSGSQSHEHGSDLLDFWGGVSDGGVLIAGGSDFRINSTGTTAHQNIDHSHAFSGTTGTISQNHTHDVSGNTGTATPSVTGTAGSGMSLDAPAHIFIGSLLVRF